MNLLTVGFLFVVAGGAPATESGRMSLSPRQPVYRQTLYATQSEQPIVAGCSTNRGASWRHASHKIQ